MIALRLRCVEMARAALEARPAMTASDIRTVEMMATQLSLAAAKLQRVSPRLCERRTPGAFTGVATAFLRRAASILAMRARFAAPESGGCSGMAAPA